MLDNSILSIGTIKILNDFGITTPEQLLTTKLPKIGNKSHVYAYNSFKKRNLVEIEEYLTRLKFEPYFGKQIKVTFEKFTGETIYNVIGFDKNNDIILETVKGALIKQRKPFSVDKLWFNREETGRIIEIMELSTHEIELQNQLKEIIKINGYWSQEVLNFNASINLEIALKINNNVDKSYN